MAYDTIKSDLENIMYLIGTYETSKKQLKKSYKINKICYISNWICLSFIIGIFGVLNIQAYYNIFALNRTDAVTHIRLLGIFTILMIYLKIFDKIIDDYYDHILQYYSNCKSLSNDFMYYIIDETGNIIDFIKDDAKKYPYSELSEKEFFDIMDMIDSVQKSIRAYQKSTRA